MDKKKFRLEESKKFCLVPWIHLHTWPNGDTYPCCLTPIDQPIGNFQDSSLKELWNSEKLKKLRLNILEDKESSSCQRCYELQESGIHSFRQWINTTFSNDYHMVENTDVDGNVEKINLKYWDFRFSNICNFRCRSCGPQLSSAWYHESEKLHGKFPPGTKQYFYSGGDPKKLWEELFPYLDEVEHIYFAGGEPLLMDEHYRILNALDKMKKYDVYLRYNTNFSTFQFKDTNVLDLWKKFKNVEIGASLDANHKRGEYIRKGQDWQQTIENRKQLMQEAPHVIFYINCTLSIMNSFNIVDLHKEWVDQGLIGLNNFHINYVLVPEHLRIQTLSNQLKEKVINYYQNHIDNFIIPNGGGYIETEFKNAITFISKEDYSDHLPKFREIMKKLDEIRNENFVDIFPELKDLYDE